MTEKLFGDVFDNERTNVTQNMTIINRFCVPDYYQYSIMIFLYNCQTLMHDIGIQYINVQHFQAMWERGVCVLAHSFSLLFSYQPKPPPNDENLSTVRKVRHLPPATKAEVKDIHGKAMQ